MKKTFWFLMLAVAALTFSACSEDSSTEICSKGAKKCEAGLLYICSENGSEWSSGAKCGNGTECVDGGTDCSNIGVAACGKGEKKCDGNTFKTCNAKLDGFNETICADPTSICDEAHGCIECRDANDCKDEEKPVCNEKTKNCQSAEAVCGQGETKCENASVTACASDGSWEKTETPCPNGCNGLGTACAVCKIGDLKCENNQAYACASGNWLEIGNACEKGCNTLGTACAICEVNEAFCKSRTLSKCNGSQTGYDETICPLASPNCYDGQGGSCVECTTNEDCKVNRTKPFCNTSTHTCEAVACAVGEKKCEGKTFQTCNADQSGFNMTAICGIAAYLKKPICDDAKGCVECTTNAHCLNFAGKVCDTATNTCQVPACAVGETKCDGSTFQTCNDTQTGFNSINCLKGLLLCDNIKGCVECRNNVDCKSRLKPHCSTSTNTCEASTDTCKAGQTKCESNMLYTCKADGSWDVITEICSKGCNPAGTACAICNDGETKCQIDKISSNLYKCSSNAWNNVETCPDGCDRLKLFCAPCTVGATKCIGTKVSTCQIDQTWGAAKDCIMGRYTCKVDQCAP